VFSGLNNTAIAAEDWLPHRRVCGETEGCTTDISTP